MKEPSLKRRLQLSGFFVPLGRWFGKPFYINRLGVSLDFGKVVV